MRNWQNITINEIIHPCECDEEECGCGNITEYPLIKSSIDCCLRIRDIYIISVTRVN